MARSAYSYCVQVNTWRGVPTRIACRLTRGMVCVMYCVQANTWHGVPTRISCRLTRGVVCLLVLRVG